MEVLLGLTTSTSTILATSRAATRGATILKSSDDKSLALNSHTLMAYSGEAGDTIQFAEYIGANVSLYTIRNEGTELSPGAVASFVRGELAKSLRSRRPYTVNLLIGGWGKKEGGKKGEEVGDGGETGKEKEKEKESGPGLWWIDYLASKVNVPYAAHGYAQYYCLSILDKHHHPSITEEEGLKILRLCTDELQRRLPIDFKGMNVKIIRKGGVEKMDWDMSREVVSA